MKIHDDLLRQIESDLAINGPFIKGEQIQIKKCWHFFTDGNAINLLFENRQDFIDGMNRIFILSQKYKEVIILAFTLMDTHLHFILYGDFDICNSFIHEYVRLTSMDISIKHSENKKLKKLPIRHQIINNSWYLKTAICYVIKNAPVGGLHYNSFDYPWSSGALYFRNSSEWTTPIWKNNTTHTSLSSLANYVKRQILKTRQQIPSDATLIGDIIFPGDYVAWEIVESIFKTHKSYNYFLCRSKEEDIESHEEFISRLSIPIQEMRHIRNELAIKLFGTSSIRELSTNQRITLAKTIKSKYNSSPKQIARLCGLLYNEIKTFI